MDNCALYPQAIAIQNRLATYIVHDKPLNENSR